MPFPTTLASDADNGAVMQQKLEDFLLATRLLPGARASTTLSVVGSTLTPTQGLHGLTGSGTVTTIATTFLTDGAILILFCPTAPLIFFQTGGNIVLNHNDTQVLLSHASQAIVFVRIGSIFRELMRTGLEFKRTPSSFGSGWASHANAAVRYWKDSAGYVQMEGLAQKTGTPLSDEVICTLAAGYGTSALEQYFPAVNANAFGAATLRVIGTSVRHLVSGANAIIDLSTVRFRQEP